jgi:hypothetical protein
MYGFARLIFRRLYKDNLEITKDRTEANIVVGQYERIRELETANKDLTALYIAKVAELGEVKGEVRALSMQTAMLSGQIKTSEATIMAMQSQLNELMLKAAA